MQSESESLQIIDISLSECVKLYEASMTSADKVAYEIAKRQLESSFDIERSIGFLEFVEKQRFNIISFEPK